MTNLFLSGYGIPIIKIRRSDLPFIMGISILVRRHFNIGNDGRIHTALTHLPLVPHICVSEPGQHWYR